MDIAKKDQTAHLSGLLTEHKQQEGMDERSYYAVDKVVLFVASFVDRSFGFVERCSWKRVNVFYAKKVKKLLFDHNGEAWAAEERAGLRLETLRLNTDLERLFTPHCLSGLYALSFYLSDHVVEDLERFESLSFTVAAPFEHYNLFSKQTWRTTSRRSLTRLYEMVDNMSRTVKGVRKNRSRYSGVLLAHPY